MLDKTLIPISCTWLGTWISSVLDARCEMGGRGERVACLLLGSSFFPVMSFEVFRKAVSSSMCFVVN